MRIKGIERKWKIRRWKKAIWMQEIRACKLRVRAGGKGRKIKGQEVTGSKKLRCLRIRRKKEEDEKGGKRQYECKK